MDVLSFWTDWRSGCGSLWSSTITAVDKMRSRLRDRERVDAIAKEDESRSNHKKKKKRRNSPPKWILEPTGTPGSITVKIRMKKHNAKRH